MCLPAKIRWFGETFRDYLSCVIIACTPNLAISFLVTWLELDDTLLFISPAPLFYLVLIGSEMSCLSSLFVEITYSRLNGILSFLELPLFV